MSRSPLTQQQRDRLKQTLASGSRLGASDLRIINIDAYRERLGAGWFKFKGIIRAYAAEAIKAELDRQDFYVETKNGYGIFFFNKDLAEIQAISDRIAVRLQEQLSREPAFGDPPLGCQATSVNCDEFLRQLEQEEEEQAPQTKSSPAVEKTAAPASRYTPLWHAKFGRIVGSLHAPLPNPSVRRIADGDYYTPTPDNVARDIAAFNAMLTDAYKLHKAGQSTAIVFSVNFKAFCMPQFNNEYMLALRQAPGKLLPFLTPRFVRIPPGTPNTLLATKIQVLAATFKRVVLHTRPLFEETAFNCLPYSIHATTWSDIEYLAGRDPSGRRSPEDIARLFCQSAKKLRVNALIDGLDSPAALKTALAAGIDFGSGTAIRPPSDTPSAQSALAVRDVRTSAPRSGEHEVFEVP